MNALDAMEQEAHSGVLSKEFEAESDEQFSDLDSSDAYADPVPDSDAVEEKTEEEISPSVLPADLEARSDNVCIISRELSESQAFCDKLVVRLRSAYSAINEYAVASVRDARNLAKAKEAAEDAFAASRKDHLLYKNAVAVNERLYGLLRRAKITQWIRQLDSQRYREAD